jgi:hypothetical protein
MMGQGSPLRRALEEEEEEEEGTQMVLPDGLRRTTIS